MNRFAFDPWPELALDTLDGEAEFGQQLQELVEPICVAAPDFHMGIPARVHESSDDFDRVCFVDDPLDLLLGSLIELYELEDVSFFASFVTKATDGPRQPEIFHAGCIHLASLTQTDPTACAGRNLYAVCGGVQVTSRRRPSSAASRATRSRLCSAHRPETRSSRRLRTARCSASGPTLAHTDTPRRTRSSRYASGRRQ